MPAKQKKGKRKQKHARIQRTQPTPGSRTPTPHSRGQRRPRKAKTTQRPSKTAPDPARARIPGAEALLRAVREQKQLIRRIQRENQAIRTELRKARGEGRRPRSVRTILQQAQPIPPKSVISEQVETRVRSDFIFKRGERTPCTARGFIRAVGRVPLRQAILAAAASYADASRNPPTGRPPKPWDGHAHINGDCGPNISDMLASFASDPRPQRIAALADFLFKMTGSNMDGELTVSFRNVIRYKNRLGEESKRLQEVPKEPDRRFRFGAGIDPNLTGQQGGLTLGF